ncbi:MAG: hypothetical protein CMA62_00585 [Euryarchaeota archaeon]|nr:hypothetical protein [Euryarchaeota archaeon]MBT86007.1 hypothetical protein [Euryarchaeota archaeon]DAC47752.1 MAG TPA: hypothetical protein D7H82_01180 [Candidatus Poseidoniales archaeon]HII33494.1 hypothetical protein [Candidatus Thalassarchaeaceae archaeon]|tara:strand:+ start:2141 stop:2746 length:606 start_codon:yes stop_codon:yes gene_type:complete
MNEEADDGRVADVTECPGCSSMTEHAILKRSPKGKGEDLLVRCLECSEVHLLNLRPAASVKVKVTLSKGEDSKSVMLESDSDEIISVGDLFQFEDSHWSVTRIEIGDKISADSCLAREIVSMWSVNKDTCVVKITLTDEENSVSSTIDCDPEKEFSCGTVMRIDGRRWRIRAIHTGEGRTLRGKRVAADIRRMYLHPVVKS